MVKIDSLQSEKQSFVDAIGYIIMYLMVGFIPHIYRYMNYSPSKSESVYFKNPIYADLYMLAKSKVFLFLTVLLLGVFLYQLLNRHYLFIKDKITIGTGVVAVVIILSSLMSKYQDIVYWGAKDRFEGMWVWLAYLVVFTVARYYGTDKKFLHRLLMVFIFSAGAMAVLGLTQIMGYDIYTAGPLRWICFPKEIAMDMSSYMVENTSNVLAVGALYNSNYFGVYCGIAALGALFFSIQSEPKFKTIYGSVAIISYGAMIASRSEAALLGFTVALFMAVVMGYKAFAQNKVYTVILIVATIFIDRKVIDIFGGIQSESAKYIYYLMGLMVLFGAVIHLILVKFHSAHQGIKKHALTLSIATVLIAVIGFNMVYQVIPTASNSDLIETVSIEKNKLLLKMIEDEALKFEFLASGINVFGEDNRVIMPESNDRSGMLIRTNNITYELNIKMYSNGYLATLSDPIGFNVFFNGETIQYVDRVTGVGMIQYPEKFEYYSNKTNAFSKRGYIWGTYMPILRENILLGSGLDTYLNIFPQNDFIGKHNAYTKQYSDIMIDKPHSMYIMIGLATGIFGVLGFIIFIVLVVQKYYRNVLVLNLDNSIIAILVAMFIAAIINDSIIPMTLIMFCFGGSVLAVNDVSEIDG